MYLYPMDDDVPHELDRDSGTVRDLNSRSAPVDGLVALHDQLLLEHDQHSAAEYDPQWLLLDHGVAEGPWSRVLYVLI